MQRKIKVITGPMFSGKTTELMRLFRADKSKKILIKHSLDDARGGLGQVKTHDGKTMQGCVSTSSLKNMADKIGTMDSFYIDEVQFFDTIEMQYFRGKCVQQGRSLIVAGLLRDRNNGKFPTMKHLLLEASEAVFLKADCACGNEATETKLTTPVDVCGNLVGGSEKYSPVCFGCFHK